MNSSSVGGICLQFAVVTLAMLAGPAPSIRQALGQGESATAGPRASASAPAVELLTAGERAWLREHPVIRVAQDPGWPPIEFTDDEGQPSGISNDYLQLIEQRLGIKFERVRNLDWQEAYARLQRWEIDMTTSVSPTPLRREFWAFTKPYMNIRVVIVTRENVTYVSGLHALAGREIAVVDGYIASEIIPRDFPDIQLVKVKTVKEGLDLLQRDEVFAVVDNMLVIGYYMAQLKLANLKIAGETRYVNAQSMAVRRDWAILAGILQKALDSISPAERASIYQKWVPIRYEHGVDYSRFWQALAVFAAILTGLGLWIRRLFREIASRRAAEAALRESEEKYRLLFDNAGDPIFICDEKARMLAVNRLAIERLGYTHDELMSMTIEQMGSPTEVGDAVGRMASVMEKGLLTFETAQRPKQGPLIPVEVSARRITWNGKPAIMNICRDITERKRAEEEQSELQAQLFQAQKMESVGRLAGGVAHDFNNMLAVILGHAEMALEHVNLPQSLYADLQRIQEAAQRSAELTRQLLAFARKQTVCPKVLDLNEAVSGMLRMLQRLIGEDIDLVWKPGAGLWLIRMDPTQIDQILANLSVNARDAMHEGGKLVIETQNTVVSSLQCAAHAGCTPGDYVQLIVTDTGTGMDQGTLDHLFEPFFTTKEVGRGTGLGMATIYGIISQNHGFIDVHSEPGQGTSLKVSIPRYAGDSTAHEKDAPSQVTGGGEETVLLVEDESAILTLGATMLQRAGYRVLTAGSPAEAIQLADAHVGAIHLIITDVVMPEMNGLDLAQRLLPRYPGMKRLFMSGYTADIIAHHGVVEDGVHFLQKPFLMNDLITRVREVLDQR